MRVLLVLLTCLAMAFLCGCGKITLSIATVFERGGSCERTIHVIAEGMFATMLADSSGPSTNPDWKTETYFDGDKLNVVASRSIDDFPTGKTLCLGGPEAPDSLSDEANAFSPSSATVRLEKDNYLWLVIYRYYETYPSSPPAPRQCSGCGGTGATECILCDGRGISDCFLCDGTGRDINILTGQYERCRYCGGRGSEQCDTCSGTGRTICSSCDGTGEPGAMETMGEGMARSMFAAENRVTLPGKVIDGNADRMDGGLASWVLSLDSFESGRRMVAQSRCVNWVAIIATAMAVAGCGVALVVKARKGRTRRTVRPRDASRAPTDPSEEEAAASVSSAEEPEQPGDSPARGHESAAPEREPPRTPLSPGDALARAQTLAGQQRHEEVIELLAPCLPVDAEYAGGWMLLAVAYFGLSRWTDAERAASCYVGLQPEDPTAYANWGATLRKLGRFSAARAAQGKALALDPEYQYAKGELHKIARDEAR